MVTVDSVYLIFLLSISTLELELLWDSQHVFTLSTIPRASDITLWSHEVSKSSCEHTNGGHDLRFAPISLYRARSLIFFGDGFFMQLAIQHTRDSMVERYGAAPAQHLRSTCAAPWSKRERLVAPSSW